jgi:hypothetical protein
MPMLYRCMPIQHSGLLALFLLVFYIWDSISLAFGVRDASLTFTMIIFKANYDVREEHISHGLLCISRAGSLSCRALGRTQHVGPWSISFFRAEILENIIYIVKNRYKKDIV